MPKPAKKLRSGQRADITYYDTRREAEKLLSCNSAYLDNLVERGIVHKIVLETIELFNAEDLRVHLLNNLYEDAEIKGLLKGGDA